MSEFVKTLLSLSVAGALLLLLIWSLKPLYRNSFSRRWQYYIWIVAVLRFLLPFTPDTTLVGTLFERFQTTEKTEAAGQDRAGREESLPLPIGSNETGSAQTGPKENFAPAGNVPANAALPLPDTFTCLFYVWALTALALFIRRLLAYQGILRLLRAGNIEVTDPDALRLLSDCREKLGVKTRAALYRNALVGSPIMTGFFRPSIILPTEALGERELRYVLVHELQHYKQRDMFYKWLIQLVVCAHWFNPLVYLLEREVNRACELSCDEAVISALDEQGRREYGDVLIWFSKAGKNFNNTSAAVTLTEGAKHLKERLGAIMSYKKKTKLILAASLAAALALSAGGFAIGAYAAQPKNDTPASLMGTPNPVNLSGPAGLIDPAGSANSGNDSKPSGNTEQRYSEPQGTDGAGEERVYVPLWMKPYSVIIYDENLNYTVVQGGELTPEEIAQSEEIAVIGYEDHSDDMLAYPNIKAEYDLHGFIQNIYYRVPGTTDQYQLSDPADNVYFFVGEWHDDMGSELVISKNSDSSCTVDFGIYKLAYMWDAGGAYDVNTGIFSFAGTDDMGNALAAEIVQKDENHMLVTLTASAYASCPPGTQFEFARDKSEE